MCLSFSSLQVFNYNCQGSLSKHAVMPDQAPGMQSLVVLAHAQMALDLNQVPEESSCCAGHTAACRTGNFFANSGSSYRSHPLASQFDLYTEAYADMLLTSFVPFQSTRHV